MVGVEWKNHAMSSIFLKKGDFLKEATGWAVPLLFQWTSSLSFQETPGWMPSVWSHDPCWPKDNRQYQVKQIIPGTRLWLHQQPPQSLRNHWASCPSSAPHKQAPRYNQQLLAGVKDLYLLTQLLNQGAFFHACIYIQCPLLLTLYMLISSFCFNTCLLF